jgi:hypothetical protein
MTGLKLNIAGSVRTLKTVRLHTNADPTDNSGTELPQFGLYQVYPVERNKVESIIERLYRQVFNKVSSGGLGDSKAAIVRYSSGYGKGLDERTYIIISRETRRNTQAKIFMRFHHYGDHLYVGIDSYVLGQVNWTPVFWRLLISAIVFGILILPLIAMLPALAMGMSSNSTGLEIIFFILLLFSAFSAICWSPVISRFLKNPEKSMSFAFRQAFPGTLNIGSFNIDDVMMFLKSTLSVGAFAVRDVLKDEGLPIETLDGFIQNITVSNVFQGSVGAVAGNVQGNLINNPGPHKS